MAAKDFGPIHKDYEFFMAHATEAESDAAEYARELAGFADGRAAIRILDFGCGSGSFTEQLLATLHWPAQALELTLVEPVRERRGEATERLAKFTQRPISVAETAPDAGEPPFDLILANHVLYYVDDLDDTLHKLVGAMAPGGKLLTAIAPWDNMLLGLWKAGFALLGRPVPYYTAEDVAGALTHQGIDYRRTAARYAIRFPDSTENRRKILRFLFANYLDELPLAKLLSQFDPYAHSGQIEIATSSDHFAVELA